MRKILFILTVLFVAKFSFAQQDFYDVNTIQRIDLYISQPNWDYRLDTAKAGGDTYLMIDSARINGTFFLKPGVKYKGNSSYDPNYVKNPFHIALDEFISNDYNGITSIKLSNGYADPSMIREVLAYKIIGSYMKCPRSNFAKLYINGNYIGLYSNDEDISKTFCSEKFYSSKSNTFIKANPIVTPSTNTKSNLKYINADSTSYFNFYEMKSKRGWKDLVALCDSVSNNNSTIENIIDVDRFLWMLAFNSVTVNLDSYSGAFCQNYYLFKDNAKRFNPIVWDLNMAFGGFAFVGVSNSSLGSLTIANMQSLTPTIHANDVYWPIINIVMNKPEFRRKYFAHIRTILDEYFTNDEYLIIANSMQSLIDAEVAADVNKFYSYTQFQNGLTENVNIGNYAVPGIKNLMSARSTYLRSFSEISAAPPSIHYILHSAIQLPDSSLSVRIRVSNANNVKLYYRHGNLGRFNALTMYDDGAHGDEAAGDSIYGLTFNVKYNTQYYYYIDNNDAGVFYPMRAEHEFLTINSTVGMGDTKYNKDVVLFPNPATSNITLQTEHLQVGSYKIINTLSNVIQEGVIENNLVVDTSTWPNGVYYFVYSNGAKKFIVQK